MKKEITAMPINSNTSFKCYLSVLNAKDIFDYCEVSRVQEGDSNDEDRGFQRHLNQTRAKDIANYIDNGNVIPGCIILSSQDKANLAYKDGKISFDVYPDSFFVIDGQHRLYGASMAHDIVELPVYIFNGLNLTQEVQYFLDVNSKQKGVPKTLRIELTKFLAEPDTIDNIRLKLFDKLNTDQNSPLFNKLVKTSSVVGKLSHVPFQESLDPILKVEPLKVLDFENKYKLIFNFLSSAEKILDESFGETKHLTKTVFFNALFANFIYICNLALMNGGYKQEVFEKIMSGISNIDFDSIAGTGNQANKQMADDIKNLIEANQNLIDYNELF